MKNFVQEENKAQITNNVVAFDIKKINFITVMMMQIVIELKLQSSARKELNFKIYKILQNQMENCNFL